MDETPTPTPAPEAPVANEVSLTDLQKVQKTFDEVGITYSVHTETSYIDTGLGYNLSYGHNTVLKITPKDSRVPAYHLQFSKEGKYLA